MYIQRASICAPSNTNMIPDDLRSLVVEACALPYCPDCVRARLVGFLSTESSPCLYYDEAFSLRYTLWQILTISIVNAHYHASRGLAGNYHYKDTLSRARQHLNQIRQDHHDGPRE